MQHAKKDIERKKKKNSNEINSRIYLLSKKGSKYWNLSAKLDFYYGCQTNPEQKQFKILCKWHFSLPIYITKPLN